MAVETRFKNHTFHLNDSNGRCADWTRAQMAVLYDLRDELKEIKELLNCWRIRRMMNTIERLDKRVSKRIKLKRTK